VLRLKEALVTAKKDAVAGAFLGLKAEGKR
jgi:hypothetical protein